MVRFIREEVIFVVWSDGLVLLILKVPDSMLQYGAGSMDGKGVLKKERWPDQLSKACGFPFKTASAGSRRPCGLPLSQCVRKGGDQSFRIGRLPASASRQPFQPHGHSRPLPSAQIWVVDQLSFSAGRSLILGTQLFTVLLKNFLNNDLLLLEISQNECRNLGVWPIIASINWKNGPS